MRTRTSDPGLVPSADELAQFSAAQAVVIESNMRLDRFDIEGAIDLYADDAVMQGRQGREAIRQAIMHTGAAGSGVSACHVISNMRPYMEGDLVVVPCTIVAYLLDSPRPYGANVVLQGEYVLKRMADGNMRIVEQSVEGYKVKFS